MTAYNDYLIKANVGFVDLADKFCIKLQQGFYDCFLANKINLLAMYLDTIPRSYTDSCLDEDELAKITYHIQWLLGCYTLGTLDQATVPIPSIITDPVTPADDTLNFYAWNFTAGTTPIAVVFDNALGTTANGWAMTYIAYMADGSEVDPIITNRHAAGFTVAFDYDDVHFEGVANKLR